MQLRAMCDTRRTCIVSRSAKHVPWCLMRGLLHENQNDNLPIVGVCLLRRRKSLLSAADALAGLVTDEDRARGQIYPPFWKIRTISAHIARAVAQESYKAGTLCWPLSGRPVPKIIYASSTLANRPCSSFVHNGFRRSAQMLHQSEMRIDLGTTVDACAGLHRQSNRASYKPAHGDPADDCRNPQCRFWDSTAET